MRRGLEQIDGELVFIGEGFLRNSSLGKRSNCPFLDPLAPGNLRQVEFMISEGLPDAT